LCLLFVSLRNWDGIIVATKQTDIDYLLEVNGCLIPSTSAPKLAVSSGASLEGRTRVDAPPLPLSRVGGDTAAAVAAAAKSRKLQGIDESPPAAAVKASIVSKVREINGCWRLERTKVFVLNRYNTFFQY
jgi:hypothetical protein